MNRKNILFVVLISIFIYYSNGAVITIVDNFTPDLYDPLIAFNYLPTDTDLEFFSTDGDNTVGTERESILFLDKNSAGVFVTTSIVDATWVIGWEQSTVGYAQLQYDGYDSSSALTLNPGLGGIDLTQGSSAYAFYLEISSDHPAPYIINVYGSAASGKKSTFSFTAIPTAESVAFVPYLIPFSSFTGNANFSSVYGIDLTMNISLTFSSNAIDTSVFSFVTFGYQIGGEAFLDCNSNGKIDGGETPFSGAVARLFSSTNTLLSTQSTDINGLFLFKGLKNGTYSVCVTATGTTNTVPSGTGCQSIILTNLTDITDLTYGLLTPSTISVPSNKSVEACSCTDPTCTGTATGTSCGSGVITYSDVNSTSSCPTVITRTWRISGTLAVGTQFITVTDTTKPTITAQAVNQNVNCSNVSPTINNWVANQGFASATDCFPVTWSNNWDNVVPHDCGTKTVTFTASDTCGNKQQTTASWTVFDDQPPSFSTAPSDSNAECNTNGSDLSAFNTWLLAAGFSTYSDNCETTGAIKLTNNYIPNSLVRGCNNVATVTFTIFDNCGSNKANSIARFTIQDTTSPIFTFAPQNSGAECNGNGSALAAYNAWLASHAGATASDLCTLPANIAWSNNAGSLVLGCNTPNAVSFTATDSCGKAVTQSATFTITDSKPPRITTAPTAASANCSSDTTAAFNAWVANHAGAVAVDDCTVSVDWTDNSNLVTTLPVACGIVTVQFTATDKCGVATSVSSNFTVFDDRNPFFSTAPSNLNVQCDSDIPTQFNAWLNSAGTTGVAGDNCATTVIITNDFTGSIPSKCNQFAQVHFTAHDSCGHIAVATASFSVVDSSPPVISTQPSNPSIECNSATNQAAYQSWLGSNGTMVASDSCGGVFYSHSLPNSITLPTVCSSVQTIVFTVTDSCGLTNQATGTFTITDTVPPKITTIASDSSAECSKAGNTGDVNAWLSNNGGARATDDCTKVTWSNNFSKFTLVSSCIQKATVVFTATDNCGLFSTTSATFTISDTKPPTINPLASDAFDECDGSGNQASITTWLNNNGGAVANDLCDSNALVWTNDYGSTALLTCSAAHVTFTVTDNCGFQAFTSATFTVIDSTDPFFDPVPQSLIVECDGAGNVADYNNWVASEAGSDAFDACASFVSISNTATPSGPVGCGAERVAFTAADQCSNSATLFATYSVVDTVFPVVSAVPTDLEVECDGTGNVVILGNWLFTNGGGGTASDTCSAVFWTNNFKSLKKVSNCVSAATVTFSVQDQCSNVVSLTATFSSVDSTPPTIDPQAGPLVLECDTALNPSQIQSYLRNHGGASAIDICSPVTWTNDYVSNPNSCGSGIGVLFTASDACGNTAVTSGSITINDNVSPDFVSFPTDQFVECDGCYDVECTGSPTITDDCAAASDLTLTYDDFFTQRVTIGFCPGDQILTRVWTAVDTCGNFIQRNQTIVIQIARPSGPCTPSVCPPCNDTGPICCEANSAPLPCIPVDCKAVTCLQVPCTPVECIPQVCGDNTPATSPTPIPAPPPPDNYYYLCEPVYVYVYNDDGVNDEDDAEPIIKYIYEYVSYNDAPAQSVFSFVTFIIVCLSLIF